MQRGVAGAECVRVGAAPEKENGDRNVASERRHNQRGAAVGRRFVDVGPVLQQQPDDVHVADARGEEQRREAARASSADLDRRLRDGGRARAAGSAGARPRVQVCAVGEQGAHHVAVPLGDRPHQRCLLQR